MNNFRLEYMNRTAATGAGGAETRVKTCVKIRNAYKQYAPNMTVLKGLDMTVAEGTIYGLLGPSGCGKSTLLSSIVGRTKLDSGTIQLSVDRRSDIGFMPQTLSLFVDLTIYENLIIFGYIFSMTKEQVLARADSIISFLELPSGNSFITNLSGGQQRRVSMAITFLHDPKLYILDEPTVGLDVHLVQSIWDQLTELVAAGKTIIITTHYIQEVYRAHTIGMLRNGVLLAEEEPDRLILKYNCQNLEDTFLLLSRRQESGNTQTVEASQYPKTSKSVQTRFREEEKFLSASKLKSVVYKDLTRLKRNYTYIAMVFITPIVQLIIFNTVYGHLPKNIHLGIVNDETTLSQCDNSSLFSGCFLDDNSTTYLSCLFVDILRNKTYEIKNYANRAAARDAVKSNTVWGALHFPHNYTLSRVQVANLGPQSSTADIESSTVDAWLDLSGQYIGTFVKSDMMKASSEFIHKAYRNCGLDPRASNLYPLRYEEALNVIGTPTTLNLAAGAPAAMCIFTFGLAVAGAIITSSDEKFGGTINRMLIAGVSLKEYMLSFTILQTVTQIVRVPLMMILMYSVFDNPHKGSLMSVYALTIVIGILGMFIGITCSITCDQFTSVTLVGNTLLNFAGIASGLLWPLEAQHPILKTINEVSPLTWSIRAVQAITIRDASSTSSAVIDGFGVVTLWIVLFTTVDYLFIKYKPDMWIKTE